MSVTPQMHEGIWLPEPGPIVVPSEAVEVVGEIPRLSITPKVPNYVRVPFLDGFDGRDVMIMAIEQGGLPVDSVLYIVDFASLRRPEADLGELTSLDDDAHREAIESEGFLLYFRGDSDAEGFNRSWCAWRTAQEAYIATHKPAHLKAMGAVDEMYQWYDVHMREMWLDRSKPGGYDTQLVKRVNTPNAPLAETPAA